MTATITRSLGIPAARENVRLSNGGPLLILLYGFPLWWLLGFGQLAFLLAALPMALHLWRIRGALTLPKGFLIWLVFLLFVLLSALALPATAPFGEGSGNPLTYAYRLAWYLSATIALLYVGNLGPRWTSSLRIPSAVAFMFIVTVSGGLLGLLAPDLQLRSALEWVLPGNVAGIPFIKSLISLDLAETQRILGYEQVRPKAPFPYANSWGAGFSAFLPFFLYVWCRRSSGWRLWLAPIVLAAGSVVVVFTLNRALWGALIVGAIYAAVQAIRLHRLRGFVVVYAALLVAAVLAVASGLAGTVAERLDNPHSDDRRSELALNTVESAATGSPVVGFGNTRDVVGSFDSIAGGSTAECPACGVPPLGTQGQLWLVIFAQGFIAAACFVAFIAYRMSRHLRARDSRTVALMAVPLFFLLQLPFYDSSGIPLFTTMVALALMWRSRVETELAGATRTQPPDSTRSADLVRSIIRGTPLALALGGSLALVVGAIALALPRDHRATVDVLIKAAPVNLPVYDVKPRTISVDTEARRALSNDVMAEVTRVTGNPDARGSADVSAHVGTQVLRLSYVDRDADMARRGAEAFAAAFVDSRSEYLDGRASSAVDRVLSSGPVDGPYPGTELSGQLARRKWAANVVNQEARLSRIIESSEGSAEVVVSPVVTTVQRNVTIGLSSALALGILTAAGITAVRQRGGRGPSG